MKLYYAPKSRATRVVWLLEELGLDYELVRYELGHADMRSDAFRQIHPMGRVPVLEDGDVRLFESGAILEYLLARHGDGRFRPEEASPFFPAYLQWLHYCEGMIMPPINSFMVETVFLPPERRSEVNVKRAVKLLGQMLLPLERWLSDHDYLAGEFTAADIMTGSAVMAAKNSVQIDFADLPALTSYVDRLSARPAYQRAATV